VVTVQHNAARRATQNNSMTRCDGFAAAHTLRPSVERTRQCPAFPGLSAGRRSRILSAALRPTTAGA
jgi:hypothetical protein